MGESYRHFINGIRSPATKKGYECSLRRYLNHLKLSTVDDLLVHVSTPNHGPRFVESQIIDYIMHLRENGISYATIQYLIAPIFTFYQLNDVVLNRKKVSRYLGEYKRIAKDGAYSTEQIYTALQTADQRMRTIILILSSTGARIGSLPSLTLGNLRKLPDYGLYKITFYESTNHEYYSFTTRECAQAIDSYLQYRQRCGEKITFNVNLQQWESDNNNDNETPLIRLQFDADDSLQARHPRYITVNSLRRALVLHLVKCGLRQVEHPTAPQSTKRVRKSISLANGFRKHVISTFIEAGLNHEIRELLCDHSTQLDQFYFRPTEDQVLQEYLKAETLLTVNPAARLAYENQALKARNSDMDLLRIEVEKLKAVLDGG
jgi:site-specific recombinase XerD